jgi:hypothetical protein
LAIQLDQLAVAKAHAQPFGELDHETVAAVGRRLAVEVLEELDLGQLLREHRPLEGQGRGSGVRRVAQIARFLVERAGEAPAAVRRGDEPGAGGDDGNRNQHGREHGAGAPVRRAVHLNLLRGPWGCRRRVRAQASDDTLRHSAPRAVRQVALHWALT